MTMIVLESLASNAGIVSFCIPVRGVRRHVPFWNEFGSDGILFGMNVAAGCRALSSLVSVISPNVWHLPGNPDIHDSHTKSISEA